MRRRRVHVVRSEDETSNDLLRSLVHCTFSRRGNFSREESANVACTSFRLKASIMDIVRSCPAFISIRRETKVHLSHRACVCVCRTDRANFVFSVFRTVSIFHVARNCTFKWIDWNSGIKFRANVASRANSISWIWKDLLVEDKIEKYLKHFIFQFVILILNIINFNICGYKSMR